MLFPTQTGDNNGARRRSALDCHVLMLNAHYVALRVISARRAFSLLYKTSGNDHTVAEVVHVEDGRYVSFDFDDWVEWSLLQYDSTNGDYDWIRTVRFELAVPRIIRVLTYSRINRQSVRINRRTILARDRHRCQYCGQQFPANELSLDHIVPRSQGGPLTWENIVCCCLRCNVRKGGRTPERAGMKLIARPTRPKGSPVLSVRISDRRYRAWRHFVDHAHWHVAP